MKLRQGFVSNSSSTAFIIVNKSEETKTVLDFARDNLYLLEQFKKEYSCENDDDLTAEKFLASAAEREETWQPGEGMYIVFGDEQQIQCIGRVFDYALRHGGSSEDWSWRFEEYLR